MDAVTRLDRIYRHVDREYGNFSVGAPDLFMWIDNIPSLDDQFFMTRLDS